MTNEKLERAVERLADVEAVLRLGQGGIARGTGYARRVASDLRALLSERAELLAAVERMRAGLESIAAYYPPGHRIEELARDIARAAIAEATGEEK